MAKRALKNPWRELTVAIVGAGNFGSALARSLPSQGVAVREIITRDSPDSIKRGKKLAKELGVRTATLARAKFDANVVWLCVPDDALESLVRDLAARPIWRGKLVIHSSGALTTEVLAPLKQQGASVASAHPLMTFVASTKQIPEATPFAVEGDAKTLGTVRSLVTDLECFVVEIEPQKRAAYHAFGTFTSPFLIALMSAMEEVGALAGLSSRDARIIAAPILRTTLENYLRDGAAAAFSGPIKRGDKKTIERHLDALRGSGLELLYRELASRGTKLADPKVRRRIEAFLKK